MFWKGLSVYTCKIHLNSTEVASWNGEAFKQLRNISTVLYHVSMDDTANPRSNAASRHK